MARLLAELTLGAVIIILYIHIRCDHRAIDKLKWTLAQAKAPRGVLRYRGDLADRLADDHWRRERHGKRGGGLG